MIRFTCLLIIFVTSIYSHLNTQAVYLEERLQKNDKRYESFLYVLKLLEKRDAKTLVETGTARGGNKNFSGDGGSTIIFSDWVADHNAILYSIDIDPAAIENAKQAAKNYLKNVYFINNDSIVFLENFNKQIDFLYLDSYDYDQSNPQPSQIHHLNELIAALPWLTDKTIIMIDDCKLLNGGKGKLVIEHLLQIGWKVVYDDYQVILTKEGS